MTAICSHIPTSQDDFDLCHIAETNCSPVNTALPVTGHRLHTQCVGSENQGSSDFFWTCLNHPKLSFHLV